MPAQLSNLFQRILNGFKRALEIPPRDSLNVSSSASSMELAPDSQADRICAGGIEVHHWVPTFVELDALMTGCPITIQVAYPDMANGSFVTIHIDETTTVKTLLDEALKEACAIAHEPDPETFWLFC